MFASGVILMMGFDSRRVDIGYVWSNRRIHETVISCRFLSLYRNIKWLNVLCF
jgi:hypothetical protein